MCERAAQQNRETLAVMANLELMAATIRVILPLLSLLWGIGVVTPAGYGSGGLFLIGACLTGVVSGALERRHPHLLALSAVLALVIGVVWSNWHASAQLAAVEGWGPFIVGTLATTAVAMAFSVGCAFLLFSWRKQRRHAS